MRPAQKQKLRDLILTAVFTLGIIWFSLLVWGIYGKQERARHALHETKEELETIAHRRGTLTTDIDALDTERGQEALMRGALGVARPGEEVIIVVPPKDALPPPPLPWWKRVLGVVGL